MPTEDQTTLPGHGNDSLWLKQRFKKKYLEFMLKNMFYVKINVRNEIPMAELVKIDLLFVKKAPQMKNFCSAGTGGGHF